MTADRISPTDVRYVAQLARLELREGEVERFAAQLGDILDHAASLGDLALDGIEPTAHPLPVENVFREDVVRPSLDRQPVLDMAPAEQDHRFRVPRILGDTP
ncbi:MAG: Asp-tRNA(Asn)/Glu-tRNA(Gln) amidotransferase subunit GatC [Acidimicrobiia bacterium]